MDNLLKKLKSMVKKKLVKVKTVDKRLTTLARKKVGRKKKPTEYNKFVKRFFETAYVVGNPNDNPRIMQQAAAEWKALNPVPKHCKKVVDAALERKAKSAEMKKFSSISDASPVDLLRQFARKEGIKISNKWKKTELLGKMREGGINI